MQDQGSSDWYGANDLLSNALKHDTNGAKFMDWRLPTKRELVLMYDVYLEGNGAALKENVYMSSTEYGNSKAWVQYFVLGNQFDGNKSSTGIVRAVRAF